MRLRVSGSPYDTASLDTVSIYHMRYADRPIPAEPTRSLDLTERESDVDLASRMNYHKLW